MQPVNACELLKGHMTIVSETWSSYGVSIALPRMFAVPGKDTCSFFAGEFGELFPVYMTAAHILTEKRSLNILGMKRRALVQAIIETTVIPYAQGFVLLGRAITVGEDPSPVDVFGFGERSVQKKLVGTLIFSVDAQRKAQGIGRPPIPYPQWYLDLFAKSLDENGEPK